MITPAQAQEAPRLAKPEQPAPPALSTKAKELEVLNAKIRQAEEKAAALQAGSLAPATWWTTTNAMTMSATVLVFGFLTLCLAAYVIRRGQPWEAVLKVFGMVLIVVLVVFLIVAGYDDKQIAPAVGLLGTIAGYLLGKDVLSAPKPPPPPAPGANKAP